MSEYGNGILYAAVIGTGQADSSGDELLLRGITAEITDRIVALKKAGLRLQARHGSREALDLEIEQEGVSPDDHSLYTDRMEWNAIRHELAELIHLLESF